MKTIPLPIAILKLQKKKIFTWSEEYVYFIYGYISKKRMSISVPHSSSDKIEERLPTHQMLWPKTDRVDRCGMRFGTCDRRNAQTDRIGGSGTFYLIFRHLSS